MRRAAAIALALLAATPAAADSRPHHAPRHHRAHHAKPLPDPVAYMRQLAPKWWGMQACGGTYAVTFADGAAAGPEWLGEASWIGPNGTNDPTGDPTLFHDCVMRISTVDFGSTPAIYQNWPGFCRVFLHEFGHLTGHVHSTDVTSVMYPRDMAASVPHVCLTDPRGSSFAEMYRLVDPNPADFNAHR